LALFLGLGVVPILLLGIVGYARSMRAVRGLIEAQTSAIAQQTASDLTDRFELRLSELLLLAENAETQRLYQAYSGGATLPPDSALRRAENYLSDAWALFGPSYRRIELRDLSGQRVFSLGDDALGTLPGVPLGLEDPDVSPTGRLLVPVLNLENGERVGTLVAEVHLRVVLPGETLEGAFGRSGYTVVMDREGSEILHHPSRQYVRQPLSALLGTGAWDVNPGTLTSDHGSFSFQEGDSTRIASFVSLQEPPWTVISTTTLEEFAPPFRTARQGDLLIVLLLAAVVGGAFLVTIRRTTASLEALTEASERVGKGDLDPPLPPPGPDEVGRLSEAFGLMVGQVKQMLKRVEETREMAVMGELASNVSHQIRNPLTSIKLNLQGLEEEAEAEGMSEMSTRSLGICLREVAHLEAAVRKILDLARTHPPERIETSVHGVIRDAVELLERQLAARNVEVGLNLDAPKDGVLADPEELKGVFINLLVNAEEAMPEGGMIQVTTQNPSGAESEGIIRVRVRDEGPGVGEDVREQIFRPFVTTKKDGTGFGLAVARLAVQEHQGRIHLEPAGDMEASRKLELDGAGGTHRKGATFVVELPLHRAASESEPRPPKYESPLPGRAHAGKEESP
ncbi:MAG: ATP-binding protein, partial [Gemmatimonadota bacterium]